MSIKTKLIIRMVVAIILGIAFMYALSYACIEIKPGWTYLPTAMTLFIGCAGCLFLTVNTALSISELDREDR